MAMHIGRIASHLQGAADIRRWAVENIPFTESMVGHDLFIKIGNDFVGGIPLELSRLCSELPHDDRHVRLEIARLIQSGLLVQAADGPGGSARTLVPTSRFVALLEAYARELDHVYAVRRNLRQEHLLVAAHRPELAAFAELLYDHFHDLGWLYLHNYGAICFLMATVVRNVAQLHGYRARTVSGYVEILRPHDGHRFQLGGKVHVGPGQIAGHAFCVIDESMIVDFGLGNLRRAYRRSFHWGLACPFELQPPVHGSLQLPNGETVTWKDDWKYPETEAEFAKFEPLAEEMAALYRHQFGTPEVQRAFTADAAPDSGAAPFDTPLAGAAFNAQAGGHRVTGAAQTPPRRSPR